MERAARRMACFHSHRSEVPRAALWCYYYDFPLAHPLDSSLVSEWREVSYAGKNGKKKILRSEMITFSPFEQPRAQVRLPSQQQWTEHMSSNLLLDLLTHKKCATATIDLSKTHPQKVLDRMHIMMVGIQAWIVAGLSRGMPWGSFRSREKHTGKLYQQLERSEASCLFSSTSACRRS